MSVEQKGSKFVARVYWCDERITIGVYGSREAAQTAHDAALLDFQRGVSKHWISGTASYPRFAAIVGVRVGTVKRWVHEGMPVDKSSMLPRVIVDEAKAWVEKHRGKSVAINRSAYVYVAERDDGAVKIGWTSDIRRRLRELEKDSCGKSVSLVTIVRGDKPLELRLHDVFAANRIDGEWYAVDPKAVAKALQEAA